MNYYMGVLKNYAVFTGRARRKEYWMFFLINVCILIVLTIIGNVIHTGLLAMIYDLAVLIPGIAVGIRRMHDTDHSGWWLLLPIVNLIFAVTPGTVGSNSYGADPKGLGVPPLGTSTSTLS